MCARYRLANDANAHAHEHAFVCPSVDLLLLVFSVFGVLFSTRVAALAGCLPELKCHGRLSVRASRAPMPMHGPSFGDCITINSVNARARARTCGLIKMCLC